MTELGPSGLPLLPPTVTPETARYWSESLRGALVLPMCRSCSSVFWYPRGICPTCGSTDISWTNATGEGSVYSFTVVRRGAYSFREQTPFILAYVELDEGPRVLTNVINVDPSAVAIGQRVIAVFERVNDESALLRFQPAERTLRRKKGMETRT
jgi:uncharacterized protein